MEVCLPAGSFYYQGPPNLSDASASRAGRGRGALTVPGESLAKPGKQDLKKASRLCHPGQEGLLPAGVQHPHHYLPEGGGEAHRIFHQGTGISEGLLRAQAGHSRTWPSPHSLLPHSLW